MMLTIRVATKQDMPWLQDHDKQITTDVLIDKIETQAILVAEEDGKVVACLRFNHFWDKIPFINLVWVSEHQRGQGIGRAIISHFEEDMKKRGHQMVLSSSLAAEQAQHVFRKLDYVDCGCLLLEDEGLEIIFKKTL